MGVLDIFKSKKKGVPTKELEVPPAPPKSSVPDVPVPPIEHMEVKKPKNLKLEEPAVPEIEELPEEVKKELPEEPKDERGDLKLKRPIFIHLDEFKIVLEETSLIKNILKENQDSLARVSEFKEDEEKEYERWEGLLKDMHSKLIYADKILFDKKVS